MAAAPKSYDYRIRMYIARDAKRVTLHIAVHPGRETRTLDFAAQASRITAALAGD